MIVWFWYLIIPSVLCSYKLDISVFSHISEVFFTKTAFFFNLKKIFFKINFCFFVSDPCSYQYMVLVKLFWLSLIILCTFFNIHQWFNTCLKFLICITYSSLSSKFATSFSAFPIFILSDEKGKSLRRLCTFSGYSSSSRKYSSSLWSLYFLGNLH